jgi:regulator of protease activity HflC (stomatin/prohibitin superfamily)
MRVATRGFAAEQTLTKDGASVSVDAIKYWRIVDAGRAAVQVTD